MKTPQEIKQSLKLCSYYSECQNCSYFHNGCGAKMTADTLEYINKLEQELVDRKRFETLRQKTFQGIRKALEIDDYCKSYEGTFEVTQCYSNYFEEEVEPEVIITLYCYVLGPSRNYEWRGKTFSEALDKAEKDIDKWIKEISNEEENY